MVWVFAVQMTWLGLNKVTFDLKCYLVSVMLMVFVEYIIWKAWILEIIVTANCLLKMNISLFLQKQS